MDGVQPRCHPIVNKATKPYILPSKLVHIHLGQWSLEDRVADGLSYTWHTF